MLVYLIALKRQVHKCYCLWAFLLNNLIAKQPAQVLAKCSFIS